MRIATLEQELRIEYPKAEIIRADRKLGEQVKTLRAIIQGEHAAALPLDIQATAFQRRVWQALQAIPRGATKSYSKIAADIGHPESGSRRGSRMRYESSGGCDSVSSRGARRWGSGWLPMGRGAQEKATSAGGANVGGERSAGR